MLLHHIAAAPRRPDQVSLGQIPNPDGDLPAEAVYYRVMCDAVGWTRVAMQSTMQPDASAAIHFHIWVGHTVGWFVYLSKWAIAEAFWQCAAL